MGSETVRAPRSCRIITAMAVNCFVIEPMRYLVAGPFGMLHSASAIPYPRDRTTFPERATRTAPLNWPSLAEALMYRSILTAWGDGACAWTWMQVRPAQS